MATRSLKHRSAALRIQGGAWITTSCIALTSLALQPPTNLLAQSQPPVKSSPRGTTPAVLNPNKLPADEEPKPDKSQGQGGSSGGSTPQISKPAKRVPPKLTERQTAMLKQTAAERQRVYREALDLVNESTRACRDSFNRGLMPLPDFADQTLANLEVRLVIADLQGDRAARVQALSDHLDLMRVSAKLLKDFNQPASQGWAADTAYSNLLVSNAELRLAVARGDKPAYEQAMEQGAQLAEEQFTARLTDFQNGQASLPLLAMSASYLTTTSGMPAGNRDKAGNISKYQEYLTTLEQTIEQTRKFSDMGAGIGREDRVFQAQFELAKASGQAALFAKQPDQAVAAMSDAVDASKAWFESELKFYQTGTASLRDMTQAWWSRAEVMDRSQRFGLEPDAETENLMLADLAGLKKIADGTEDLRGRIVADVAYVHVLEKLDSLWARQRAVQATATAKGPAPVSPGDTGARKIIELKPGPGNSANIVPGATEVESRKTENGVEIITPKRKPK